MSVDRSVAPECVVPHIFHLPEPGKSLLPNGAQFFFLNSADQPVIRLEFVFRAGSWFQNAPGVAFFTAKMIREGTKNYDSKSIAESLDRYGAFVSVNAELDFIVFSIHVPVKYLNNISAVIRDILFNPTFPEHELDHLKEIQLSQLLVNKQKNNFIAAGQFRKKLYNHVPYGHILEEESITAITRDQLRSHFDKFMHGKFDIFLSGNFNRALPEKIVKLIEDKLAALHPFPDRKIGDTGYFEEYIEKEDSLQSAILMGDRAINRNHKQYPAVLLLNEIFGGYFGSRLMQNIREDKGYTYGIYSHLATLKKDAYFFISSEVKKENRIQVIEEINKEIDRIKSEPVSEEELTQAKNYLKGSFLNSFTTAFSAMDKIKNMHLYNLPENYYENIFEEVDSTTPEDLQLLANEILFRNSLSSIIVG